MVKVCPICGTANDDNAKFCINCGNKLPSAQDAVDNKSKALFEEQAKKAVPIYSLSSIPLMYKSWYEKMSAGFITKSLVILFYPISFLGALGVISPFIPFQIVFLITFFVTTYYLGLVIDDSKLSFILFSIVFFILAPVMAIFGYSTRIFWTFYIIALIGEISSILVGVFKKPIMRITVFSEKKVPRLILSWRDYSYEELDQYFHPMICDPVSEDMLKSVNTRVRGMMALGLPITNQSGGHSGGGGHHGGAHGGGGGGGGVTKAPPVIARGRRTGSQGGNNAPKPLFKVSKDPYEAVAGFKLKFEGITAYLMLRIYYLGQVFNEYNIGIIYDIYLPRNGKLAKTEFMLNYINSIIRGADNFITANIS
mgnify:CR=1 FL=1